MTEQMIAEVSRLVMPCDFTDSERAEVLPKLVKPEWKAPPYDEAEWRARREAEQREEDARFIRAVGAAMDVVGDLCRDLNEGLGVDYCYLMEFVGSHIVEVTRERMEKGWHTPPAAPEAFRAFARYADFLWEGCEDEMARGLVTALDELAKAARHAATMYEMVGHPFDGEGRV